MPGGGGTTASGSAGSIAVQAEQGVEVDGSAGLEFGGLAVGDADRGDEAVFAVAAGDPDWGHAAVAGQVAEVAFDGLLGAPPQFPGGVVPHDVGGVVVAVRAQRLAEPGVVAVVAGEAGGRAGRARRWSASRRAWQGSGRQVQRARSVQVCWRMARVWTGPKEGAVKVAKTAGWVATVRGRLCRRSGRSG